MTRPRLAIRRSRSLPATGSRSITLQRACRRSSGFPDADQIPKLVRQGVPDDGLATGGLTGSNTSALRRVEAIEALCGKQSEENFTSRVVNRGRNVFLACSTSSHPGALLRSGVLPWRVTFCQRAITT